MTICFKNYCDGYRRYELYHVQSIMNDANIPGGARSQSRLLRSRWAPIRYTLCRKSSKAIDTPFVYFIIGNMATEITHIEGPNSHIFRLSPIPRVTPRHS